MSLQQVAVSTCGNTAPQPPSHSYDVRRVGRMSLAHQHMAKTHPQESSLLEMQLVSPPKTHNRMPEGHNLGASKLHQMCTIRPHKIITPTDLINSHTTKQPFPLDPFGPLLGLVYRRHGRSHGMHRHASRQECHSCRTPSRIAAVRCFTHACQSLQRAYMDCA